jgi:hypothetical protein
MIVLMIKINSNNFHTIHQKKKNAKLILLNPFFIILFCKKKIEKKSTYYIA